MVIFNSYVKSADPAVAMAEAGRRLGPPKVWSMSMLSGLFLAG